MTGTPSQIAVLIPFILLIVSSQSHAQCGDSDAGDCCAANSTPFCNDANCCNRVCDEDAYCCDVVWDACCAALAEDLCPHPDWPDQSICDPPPPPPECRGAAGDCCETNPKPGCNDAECCAAVCECDPFCCDIAWDQPCATFGWDPGCLCGPGQCGALNTPECTCSVPLADVCAPGTGDCCSANGTPSCSDTACCEAVCACDPFCCNVEWDDICATTGQDATCLCGPGNCGALNTPECSCGPPPNPADLTGNNIVGVPDLLVLLSQWGDCPQPPPDEHCPQPIPCPADFNGDGVVDVADLLFLLNNWGGG